jgi:hypothetical protein
MKKKDGEIGDVSPIFCNFLYAPDVIFSKYLFVYHLIQGISRQATATQVLNPRVNGMFFDTPIFFYTVS